MKYLLHLEHVVSVHTIINNNKGLQSDLTDKATADYRKVKMKLNRDKRCKMQDAKCQYKKKGIGAIKGQQYIQID